jgi:hypothetical protein
MNNETPTQVENMERIIAVVLNPIAVTVLLTIMNFSH